MQTVSREDKIEFIDRMQDGVMTHLLNLIDRWNKEIDNLPKDSLGQVKTVSLIAWIKRNDKRPDSDASLIDHDYRYGKFYILGCERYIQHNCEKHKAQYDHYNDIVDEIFYRQLKKCLHEERQYFESTDPYEVAKKKIANYIRKYNTTFGIHILQNSGNEMKISEHGSWDGPDITLHQCKELIKLYEELDSKVESLTTRCSDIFKQLK